MPSSAIFVLKIAPLDSVDERIVNGVSVIVIPVYFGYERFPYQWASL